MAQLTPEKQFEDLKGRIEKTLDDFFPVVGKRSELVLNGVEVRDNLDIADLRSQKKAILNGRSWAVPVYADLTLKRTGRDGETREVDRKKVLVMHLPKTTDRYGYIIDGTEYQTTNLFKLRPGVYHRRSADDKLLAEFNLGNPDGLANGRSFKLRLDPEDGVFYLKHKDSNIPAYHLIKSLGVSDEELEKRWGKKILSQNQAKAKEPDVLTRFWKAVNGTKPGEGDNPKALLGELLDNTVLDPETTSRTLGAEHKTVRAPTLLASTEQLLKMSRGDHEGDDKNSLEFLAINSIEDLIDGRIKRSEKMLRRRVQQNVDRKRSVRQILPSPGATGSFDKVVRDFFGSSLANPSEQVNPLEMISGQLKTTIIGEQGGIKSPHAVIEDAKLINKSHFGFLDPIHTPEGERTGISLSLPLGAKKRGERLYANFRNAKTGRIVEVSPGQALQSTVAFPDQYDRRGNKLVARGRTIKALRDGEIVDVRPSEVDYIVPTAQGLFDAASNLIPFLPTDQGNRAMTASRQQEQAVPLLFREAPLVQSQAPAGSKSFEEMIGSSVAHRSPVDGVVEAVRKDEIVIRQGRKLEKVQVYRDFPLKGSTAYDSEVLVKAGDRVKKGQLLADTTFTKGGTLALGTNLKTAYKPWYGYNFEDGIVISEPAAKKLSSVHIHRKDIQADGEAIISRSKYLAEYPHNFNRDQVGKLDEDGIVRVGQTVEDGDPVMLFLRRPDQSRTREQIRVFRRGRQDKFRDRSMVWDKGPGVVTDVVKKKGKISVFIKTVEPAQVGDKLVGRHGNKGVITRIVPEAEMPYTEDTRGEREHIQILLNPLGVPGRINLGQVLETAAAKIAKKQGEPYRVQNFEAGKDYLQSVKKELADAGLEDKETLINPRTGKPFRQKVLVGDQYILKLKHQVGKKVSARSGGSAMPYDVNHAPSSGPPHSGQSLGELGMYAMLAHGARENIYEMMNYKTTKNDEVWDALRMGRPVPPPKAPFAYEKFLGYLNAMRVNVKKEGNHLQLMPFTEEQISNLSHGKLAEPGLVVRGKDLQPEKGGLFDPDITGGREGKNWAHFELAEPMPNPLFEDAIVKLLGVTRNEFRDVVAGKKKVDGKTGGLAVEAMLRKVDVAKELADAQEQIKKVKGDRRNQVHNKLRILKALDEQGLDPSIYMMRSVPVMPPIFRPLVEKEGGAISANDINGLYKDLGALNDMLRENKGHGIPDKHLAGLRTQTYDGLRALYGTGGSLTRDYQGILDIIAGKKATARGGKEGSPKEGFFQKRLVKRRQDFSGRSTIIPEPRMGLDELGLPDKIAWRMYQPFIERDLIRQGYAPLDAFDAVKKHTPAAERSLEKVMQDRPVLLKRDPALHKFNVMAFKPRRVQGKAIEIHPLVTGGYNADFDGDAMSVYLPITSPAVKEAEGMFPSNNLFSPTTGGVMYTPGHEALLGLYLASQPGKRTRRSFKTIEEARSAHRRGQIEMDDVVRVGGHETTLGRLEIEDVLPTSMRETGKKKVSQMRVYDKGTTKAVLMEVAKKHPKRYAEVADKFKNLGNDYSTELGFSIGLDDFAVVNRAQRDQIIAEAERKAKLVRAGTGTKAKKDKRVVGIFLDAGEKIDKAADIALSKNPTNIYQMVASGSRGSPNQLKQIVSTPMLVMDAKSNVVPTVIPRSYSEGMDVMSYWTTLHGARKGTIQKTQGVRDPGYISKQVINSTMNTLITTPDCKTQDGVSMSIDDKDINDRYLSKSVRVGGKRYRAGTLVTPRVLAAAKKSKKDNLPVRSPMRCEAENGICQKCMGITSGGGHWDIGTNIGVLAGQALGEPSTQLSLSSFHTGGIAKGKESQSKATFSRLSQLLRMPKNLPNAAPLAETGGMVTRIEAAPQGGSYITVGKRQHYIPATQERLVKRGQRIRKGDALSDGNINPRDLLRTKGMRSVQDHILGEIDGTVNAVADVQKRNIEVVVKTLTNLTQIEDAGDHPDWVPGDFRPFSQVQAYNARRGTKNVGHSPILKGVEVLPLEMHEDWMARLNFNKLGQTIAQAAREGWKTNIHGFHPIPAVAHATEFGKTIDRIKEPWEGQY